MLSRSAESLCWLSRYVERGENIARFIDVNLHLNLDVAVSVCDHWEPLVRIRRLGHFRRALHTCHA